MTNKWIQISCQHPGSNILYRYSDIFRISFRDVEKPTKEYLKNNLTFYEDIWNKFSSAAFMVKFELQFPEVEIQTITSNSSMHPDDRLLIPKIMVIELYFLPSKEVENQLLEFLTSDSGGRLIITPVFMHSYTEKLKEEFKRGRND